MISGATWAAQTLTRLEGEDWREPTYDSRGVTHARRLRHKPLREFSAEDLRSLLGQRISLPMLMPMAVDVLNWPTRSRATAGVLSCTWR